MNYFMSSTTNSNWKRPGMTLRSGRANERSLNTMKQKLGNRRTWSDVYPATGRGVQPGHDAACNRLSIQRKRLLMNMNCCVLAGMILNQRRMLASQSNALWLGTIVDQTLSSRSLSDSSPALQSCTPESSILSSRHNCPQKLTYLLVNPLHQRTIADPLLLTSLAY